jgi:hypothetical protein
LHFFSDYDKMSGILEKKAVLTDEVRAEAGNGK